MAVSEFCKLDQGKILDEGEKVVIEKIKEIKGINDESTHLHVIDCFRNYFSESGDFSWKVVAAVLEDGGKDVGGYVGFIGYHGNIKNFDIYRPIEEQIEVKESDLIIDCYVKSGRREIDYRVVNGLRELADAIQERYLDSKF